MTLTRRSEIIDLRDPSLLVFCPHLACYMMMLPYDCCWIKQLNISTLREKKPQRRKREIERQTVGERETERQREKREC